MCKLAKELRICCWKKRLVEVHIFPSQVLGFPLVCQSFVVHVKGLLMTMGHFHSTRSLPLPQLLKGLIYIPGFFSVNHLHYRVQQLQPAMSLGHTDRSGLCRTSHPYFHQIHATASVAAISWQSSVREIQTQSLIMPVLAMAIIEQTVSWKSEFLIKNK